MTDPRGTVTVFTHDGRIRAWQSNYDLGAEERASDVAVHPEEHLVYVTGWATQHADGSHNETVDVGLQRPTGAQVWENRMEASGQYGYAIVVDPAGRRVYVADGRSDYLVVTYDALTGQTAWQHLGIEGSRTSRTHPRIDWHS